MIKNVFIFGFISIVLLSCGELNRCAESSIQDFESFANISRNDTELELYQIMGTESIGQYNPDSSGFIYQYNKAEDAPFTVWVDIKTGKIQSMLIEILGINTFDENIMLASESYQLSECESQYLGMFDEDIIGILGMPFAADENSTGMKSIVYKFEQPYTEVHFGFHQDQYYRCSSIMINWSK